jgi:hypothetical protein
MFNLKKIRLGEPLEFFVGLFVSIVILFTLWACTQSAYESFSDQYIAQQAGLGVGPGDVIKALVKMLTFFGAGVVTFVYVICVYGFKAWKYIMEVIRGERSLFSSSEDSNIEKGEDLDSNHTSLRAEQSSHKADLAEKIAVATLDRVNQLLPVIKENKGQVAELKAAFTGTLDGNDQRISRLSERVAATEADISQIKDSIEKVLDFLRSQ